LYVIRSNSRKWEEGWGCGGDDEAEASNNEPSAPDATWIEEAGAIGVLNAMLPTNLPTPWRVPPDSLRGNELRMVLDREAPDEKLAECPICIEGLCKERCAVFVSEGRRACAHYIHLRCATEMFNSGATRACPMCRVEFEEVRVMPRIENPREWFATVDAAGDGRLSRREVEVRIGDIACCQLLRRLRSWSHSLASGSSQLALVSQFPIDWAALTAALDDNWSRWDHDGSGYVSAEEFVTPVSGLLDYVRKHLLTDSDHVGAVII
jgi:hypothetical protein